MAFRTVPDATKFPIVERESTLAMMPPLYLKAKVVVPFANLISWEASLSPDTEAKFDLTYWAGCGQEQHETAVNAAIGVHLFHLHLGRWGDRIDPVLQQCA